MELSDLNSRSYKYSFFWEGEAGLFVHLFCEGFYLLFLYVLVVGFVELLQELAVHHCLYAEFGEACAMISNSVLRVVIGSNFFASIQCGNL